MPLSPDEIRRMFAVVRATVAVEIDCDACVMQVGEFVGLHLAGKPVPEALKMVEQHLSICQECREDYELLERAFVELAKARQS